MFNKSFIKKVHIDASGNMGIGTFYPKSKLDVSGNIIPSITLTYDLGTPDYRWRDIYLSGNSIDLGGTKIQKDTVTGGIKIADSGGNTLDGQFKNIISSGNVDIGTTNPTYKLQVIGDTRIQGNLIVNGTQTVVDTNVNTTEILDITNDGTGPALRVTQTGVQPIVDFCDDSSSNIVVRIADGGNVGIGTIVPSDKLHVVGNVKVNGDVSANNFIGKLKWTDVSGAPPYELPPASVVVYNGVSNLDSSFMLVNGQTLNRVDYPELANMLDIPSSQPTFTLPSVSDFQPNWTDISTSSLTYIKNKPNVYGDSSGNVDVSGNLKLKDGTISNPVLTFSNDTNTGLYRPGNDVIGFVTGGTERMKIDASGNIGIGTTNPQGILHINDTGAIVIPVGTTIQQPSNPVVGMMRYNTTNSLLQLYNGSMWMNIFLTSNLSASGGNTTTDIGGYRIHTFTSSGSFNVISGGYAEVLVVAGGGGGGNGNGSGYESGGGGAGGLIYVSSIYVPPGTSTITIGAGGAGSTNGGNTTFSILTAIGGGRGGSYSAGASGGSGGGGSHPATAGGAGTAGQGNNGGTPPSGSRGAGGGGAGSAGNANGPGGDGLQFSISGTPTYYAAGGGGVVSGQTTSGGLGGGGSAASSFNTNGGNASGYGSGGGGAYGQSSSYIGGTGSSGIVIIRYLL